MTWPNAAAFYADVGRYLAKGWPRCCGETMQIEPTPAPNVNPPPKRPR